MLIFLRNVKRAADFFSINPEGTTFETERRIKGIEASLIRLPKAILNRHVRDTMQLEYDIYELKETIKTLQSKLDKEQVPTQLVLPVEQARTSRKRKAVKLQNIIEEEVKKVKSKLTQAKVKRLFEYKAGELYWKVDKGRSKKGDKAGSIYITRKGDKGRKFISIDGTNYSFSRIVFLMFHGYLPEYVSFIDKNPLNTQIENLRAANNSQLRGYSKKPSDNTSGYKGVTCYKDKYLARITKQGKHYHLGCFNTPQEAYKAYCKAAKKLHGEFAQVA